MRSGIYKITNEITGKFYIGSSDDVDYRWEVEHRGNLNRNQHCNPKLQHSWNFYGGDKFTMTLLEEVEPKKELLLQREQYYLDTFKPYIQGIGYNICPTAFGGDNLKYHPRGKEIIQEWKDKYSKLYTGEGNPMFGKTHTEYTIKLQKEKSVGRYTLDWFIERCGQIEGEKKFQARNEMLKNRKLNYSYDNKCTGVKRGPMSDGIKKRISEGKHNLNVIREDLHKDILSNNFTLMQLQLKYNTSKATILRERRKLM